MRVVFWILFCAFLTPGLSWSFTLIFKDGRRIECEWIGENEREILVREEKGSIRVYDKSLLDMKAMASGSRMPDRSRADAVGRAQNITGIRVQENDVVLIADGRLQYNSFELVAPPRIVIDLQAVSLSRNLSPGYTAASSVYSGVRLSQFQYNPRTVRAVIDLKKKVNYQLSADGNELHIRLGHTSAMTVDNTLPLLSSLAPSVPNEHKTPVPDVNQDIGLPGISLIDEFRPIPVPQTKAPSSFREHVFFEVALSSVYEDNIDHDEVNPIESVGVVPSLSAQVRGGRFYASYQVGFHQYTNTDKWDRVSHVVRSGYVIPLGDKFLVDARGEISLGGSSEDRERGDQYAVKPVLAFFPSRSTQIEVVGAYRARRFETSSNAINRYIGIGMEQEFGDHEVFGEYRYEVNDSENPRSDRNIYTYKVGYKLPLPGNTTALFGAQLRATDYRNRFVELEVEDGPDIPLYLRKDKKWAFRVALDIPLSKDVELVPEYEYETRTSNDPEKYYVANVASISIAYKFW